jgi:SAM-dependent methyltransferase
MLRLCRCPDCGTEVTLRDAAIRCRGCGRTYPSIGDIPVLCANAEEIVEGWRFRVSDFIASNASVRTTILAELAADAKLQPTRARLEALHAQLAEHEERLTRILGGAGLSPLPRTRTEGDVVPGEGSITSYYHQIHRDWGWGDESTEAAEAIEEVSHVLGPGAVLGATLVLGAGAARLPIELHQRFGGGPTVAVDLNPLPFLIASRMLASESVSLYEFPIRPRSSDSACVDRVHRRVGGEVRDFHLLFADGLAPPFAPAAFDTVLTPWFIDQVPRDIAELVPQIRRVLKPGGRWLNFGPLVYHPAHTRIVHRYCVDEVLEILRCQGFEVRAKRLTRMKYMESPSCSQGRTELILTFDATKLEQVSAREPAASAPWIDDPTLPIVLDGLERYEAPHPMFAAVVALIDGKRSARDIADRLVASHGLPKDAATPGVQACLREILRKLG